MRPAAERRLSKLFRSLDDSSRQSLLDFAEFLASRSGNAEAEQPVLPTEPVPEPRPMDESVVAAIKRLRRTYPMLEGATMLNQASSLMAAHVLQGRAARDVIDELETLFAERFEAYKGRN